MLKPYKPTELEYTILQALWALGPVTVRDVYDRLKSTREIGYTSVLKTLQIMNEKGLVRRDERERAHIYTPVFTEVATQTCMLNDLMQRVFGGSAQHLVLRALQVKPATVDERAAIRRLLDDMELSLDDMQLSEKKED